MTEPFYENRMVRLMRELDSARALAASQGVTAMFELAWAMEIVRARSSPIQAKRPEQVLRLMLTALAERVEDNMRPRPLSAAPE